MNELFPDRWAQGMIAREQAIEDALKRAERGAPGHWARAEWPSHYGYPGGSQTFCAESEDAVRACAAHWRETHRTPKPEVEITYFGLRD